MKRDDLKHYIRHFMQFHQNQINADDMLYFIENVLMNLQPFTVVNKDCECVCKCDEHLVELILED